LKINFIAILACKTAISALVFWEAHVWETFKVSQTFYAHFAHFRIKNYPNTEGGIFKKFQSGNSCLQKVF
jgi:hypothetical protein